MTIWSKLVELKFIRKCSTYGGEDELGNAQGHRDDSGDDRHLECLINRCLVTGLIGAKVVKWLRVVEKLSWEDEEKRERERVVK